MKRTFAKKLLSVLCIFAILFPTVTMSARADQKEKEERSNIDTIDGWFGFETQHMDIKAGGSASQRMTAYGDYDIHWTGSTSKKTYVEASFKSGSQDITFHIGEDETAKRVTFYFYVANAPHDREIYQPVDVDIIYPVTPAASAPVAQTATAATAGKSAPVPYPDQSSGLLTTELDDFVGLLSDANGTPRAAFAIAGTQGQLCKLQVAESATLSGFTFPSVQTVGYTGQTTVTIQEADKLAAQAAGIYGLCVNGTFVLWP